jgi:hypothetical protein
MDNLEERARYSDPINININAMVAGFVSSDIDACV